VFPFESGPLRRSFQVLAYMGLSVGLSAFGAPPVVRTVPWNPSDPASPHSTFPGRSVTLKATASEHGTQALATWDFGDGSQPQSFTVAHSYDVSATHAYFGTVGSRYTAKLTVANTATGESSSAEYPIAIQEKTLALEAGVAMDEALWHLHTAIHADASQVTGWNVLAFERTGHLESGDTSDPYTETVAQAIRILVRQNAAAAAPGASAHDPPWFEALAVSGSPEARAALARAGASTTAAGRNLANAAASLGLTADGQDIPSRLLALSAAGVGRPDARWVQLESQLRDNNNFDLSTASLFQVAQALRNEISNGKVTPIQFIQSETHAPLDWYAAQSSLGDSTDGVARTLINRQNSDGSFPSAPESTAQAVLALDTVSPANSVTNVSTQMSVVHTAWAYSRTIAKYTGNLTITNTGAQAITGPFTAGLVDLPPGVTLFNGTGTFNGAPYIDQNGSSGAADINVFHQGKGKTVTFDIEGNTTRQTLVSGSSASISVDLGGQANSGTLMTGKILNNVVGNAAVTDSGSALSSGIAVGTNAPGTITALITGNTVKQTDDDGLLLLASSETTSTMNITASGNDFEVSPTDPNTNLGIELTAGGSGGSDVICANISGNSKEIGNSGVAGIATTVFGASAIELQGYTGAANNSSQIATFLNGTATTVSPAAMNFGGGGTVKAAPSTCPTPP
jgi:hypothetical protein